MENNIVAIDPGATGSAAFFISGGLTQVFGFTGKPDDMRKLYRECAHHSTKRAYVEAVRAWARDGKKSAFSFGQRKAEVETVLHLTNIEIVPVEVQTWPKLLGLPKRYEIDNAKKRREARRQDQENLAKALYPALTIDWATGDIWASVLIGYSQVMQHDENLKNWLMKCRQDLGW
jgi:hypothetical protein